MAEDDIVVKLGLDTSDLEAGMGRAKALMRDDVMAPKMRASEWVELQNAKEAATKRLSEAQDGLAQSSDRAGSGFERMASRIMTRLGVFYLIHEAIKAITAALHESVAYEEARVRFESLSTAVEGAATSWGHLRQLAHETGIPVEDLASAQETLEKMGVSASEVGPDIDAAARYAKILGEDVKTVAQEIARVELKKGTIQDMQDLAYATHDINLQRLVNDLAEAQRQAPLLAEQQAQLDRQINRAADDQDRALNRAIEDADRLRNAQLSVAQAIVGAGKAYQEFTAGGTPTGPMGRRMAEELSLGRKQLAEDALPSVAAMIAMGMKGREINQILMQEAQRYHEQERIHLQHQEEDRKRLREQAQEDARENVRLKAADDLRKAEDAVAQAIKASTTAQDAFAKAMGTAAGQQGLIASHLAEAVQDSKTLLDSVKGWNVAILGFVDSIKTVKTELKPVVELAQQFAGFIGQVVEQIQKLTGFDLKKPPAGITDVWSPTHRSPADVLRAMPFGIGQAVLPHDGGGQHPVAEKIDEQGKKQDKTNNVLDQIYTVLHNAFGI